MREFELRIRDVTKPFELCKPSVDPSADFGRFVTEVDNVVNHYFPVRTKRVRKRSDPWMNDAVKHLIRDRDKIYKEMVVADGEKQTRLRAEFRDLRHRARKAITDSRQDYFLRLRNNKQKLWRALNEQLNRNVRKDSSADLEIDEINQHFVSMGQHGVLHAAPPGEPPSDVVTLPGTLSAFDFQSVLPMEVHETLCNIVQKRKASGPNGIPYRIMAKIHHYLVSPLTHLISKCLSAGVYPDVFKMAEVVPIPKTTHPSTSDEYRPITLVSNLSKVFEKVVQAQLVTHLKEKKILSQQQSGFRAGHSTETLLLKVTERWKQALDDNEVVAVAFLDLKKAFDSVHHGELLSELSKIGVRGNEWRWFRSYLCGRTQRVVCGEKKSQSLPVVSGVPQGTVLGPVFWTIYGNGVLQENPTEPDQSVESFADDTALYCVDKNPEVAVGKLNALLQKVERWFSKKLLRLNPQKCVAMIISSDRRARSLGDIPEIILKGEKIEVKSEVKYLGVVIDKHLKWDCHVRHLKKSIYHGVHMINRLKDGLPVPERIQLYHAFVEPHLDRCATVWSATTKQLQGEIEKAQRDALRSIADRRKTDRASDLFQKYRVIPAVQRWRTQEAVWLFGIKNAGKRGAPPVPDYLLSLVQFESSGYDLRRPDHIKGVSRTNVGEKMLSARLRVLYQTLPVSIWTCLTVRSFRQKVISYLGE